MQVLDATNGKPVRAIIHIRWIDPTGIEVQIECIRARRTTRPVVAVAPLIAQGTIRVIAVTS